MISIAGAGPSAIQVDYVDVATKKRKVDSDYIFCRRYDTAKPYLIDRTTGRLSKHPPLMIYYRNCGCACYLCDECKETDKYYVNSKHWDDYYRDFSDAKPSTGLLAVFGVVERWHPKTVALIGFDWILDGNPLWTPHNAEAERKAILSLVRIKDLRV